MNAREIINKFGKGAVIYESWSPKDRLIAILDKATDNKSYIADTDYCLSANNTLHVKTTIGLGGDNAIVRLATPNERAELYLAIINKLEDNNENAKKDRLIKQAILSLEDILKTISPNDKERGLDIMKIAFNRIKC